MIVDGHNGVGVFFTEGTDEVIGSFLHLWVSTLDGIQLNTIAVTTCVYGGYTTTAESDTIVVTTDDHNFIPFLGFFLQTVTLRAVTNTTSQHDHFVIGIFGVVRLLVLKGQHGSANQRLSELITKVGGTVGCLDQNLFWCLVEPLADRKDVLPVTLLILDAGVSGHIDGCSSNRP